MKNLRSYMTDMLIMLTVIAIVAIYTYGFRALVCVLLSIIAAIATETIGYIAFMKRNPERLADLSAIFTGFVVALALPSTAPLWLAPVASALAIAIGKLPFGHAESTPFVPAAVGLGLVTLSHPTLVYTYPDLAIGDLSVPMTSDEFVAGTSLAQMLQQSKSIGTNVLNVLDVFVGRIPGAMGASCAIMLIGALIYLVIRKQPGVATVLSLIITSAIFAFLFPRVWTGRIYSVIMELSAGLLLYVAIFFLTDPTTSPNTTRGRIIYGFVAGLLTMILRRVGPYEESVIFVVLLLNATSDIYDAIPERIDLIRKANKAKKANEEKKAKREAEEQAEPATEPSDETSEVPVMGGAEVE